MSDFVYNPQESIYMTPTKANTAKINSYKEVYLDSFKVKKNKDKKCCLCLLYSNDCSNFRCFNISHYVCSECACDWEIDKLCPVCKISSHEKGKRQRGYNDLSPTEIKGKRVYPFTEAKFQEMTEKKEVSKSTVGDSNDKSGG